MIQGLRLLPHYQEALDAGLIGLDCSRCMSAVPVTTRQSIGCGHLPPTDGSRPWTPTFLSSRGFDANTCAGYVCTLPEVQEVVSCFPQWEQGTLTEYLEGEAPSRPLLDALAVLKGAIREFEAAQVEESRRKGGA